MRAKTNIQRGGTRFRLFPQPPFLETFAEPETVIVSSPQGSVGPGPADHRMYAVDPIGKQLAYGPKKDGRGSGTVFLPPWRGDALPPALPDADGHFDYIPVEWPEFEAAHLFAAARLTLDIWEGYLGHPVQWHFHRHYDRLELVLQRNLEGNAHMGYGFLEVGFHRADDGEIHPFSLNFDLVAHEVGHCIVFALMGAPDSGAEQSEYYGFHESAADITALIAALHFNSVVDELLTKTRGNLYTFNIANRIAELSGNEQIRSAANKLTMHQFADGWEDEHNLAQPLTGAVFDILVDIFHEELLERNLISARAEDLSDRMENDPDYHDVLQPLFDEAYQGAEDGFRAALFDARDTVGAYMIETWRLLSPDYLGYDDVADKLRAVDRMLNGGRYRRIIDVNLRRRAIGLVRAGPRLKPPGKHNHFNYPRTFVPTGGSSRRNRRLSFRERYDLMNKR